MKQNRIHRGKLPYVKQLIKELNRYKQSSRGEAMSYYVQSADAEIMKVIDTVAVGYKNKQISAEDSLPQDQVLTPQEYELVDNKDDYEEVLILGNYDKSSGK